MPTVHHIKHALAMVVRHTEATKLKKVEQYHNSNISSLISNELEHDTQQK